MREKLRSITKNQGEEECPINNKNYNWIGHILLRNCLLKHVTEGMIERKIEVMGRRGRRRKKLLDDLRKKERVL
jgi:hypothetical protein